MTPVLRAAPTPRDHRHDLILAGVLLVGGILSAALSSIGGVYEDEQAPLWQALVYLVILTAPIAVRRRWPSTVAVVVSVAYFVAVTLRLPEVFVGNIAMFIALYTAGAWAADRRRAAIVRIAIIVGMFVWLLVVMFRDAIDRAAEADVAAGALSPYIAQMLIATLINVLYFAGAYYFGDRAWAAAVQREVLEQRTLDLEREREITGTQAVALDRVRIARELHDVVAHHVSVMGVQAGAARAVIDRDPAGAKVMLAGVEQSAREAISDLRHLLETLRTPESDDTTTGPIDAPSTVGLDTLAELVAASAAAGLDAELSVIGEPVPVAGIVQVNLYRIAQEALTNARRHAGPGARADVRLRYGATAIELEVVNTGRLVRAMRPGLGQLGMQERAAASGGTIEIGPRERGGFLVRVHIPVGTPSGAPAAFAPRNTTATTPTTPTAETATATPTTATPTPAAAR